MSAQEKALSLREAMDALPMDVVIIILRKLAEQDPLSLLQAKCACKTFLNSAPGIHWRDAFLTSYPAGENVLGVEESTELEDELMFAWMGGYKRLAAVKNRYRWASKKHSSKLNKTTEKLSKIEVEGAKAFLCARPPPNIVAGYLFVFKLRGKTLSGTVCASREWYLGCPDEILKGRSPGKGDAESVPVTAVLGSAEKQILDDTYRKMLIEWRSEQADSKHRRKVGKRVIKRLVEERVSELEIYAFLSPDVNPSWERRECKPWDLRLSIKTKWDVYEFPVCRGKVYLVSPEPIIWSSVSSKSVFTSRESVACIARGLIGAVVMLVTEAVWKFLLAAH